MSFANVLTIAVINTLAVIVFNLYLTFDGVADNTLSHVMRTMAYTWPVAPFLYGFLGGHWFHWGTLPQIGFWKGFMVVAILCACTQAVCKIVYPQGIPKELFIVLYMAGTGAGIFFWPV